MKSVVAKEADGNVQITFTIPFSEIKKAQDETVVEMAPDIEVAGFRKGNAPLDKVKEKIPQSTLIEHSLSHILPKALSDAIKEHKLKIAIYPKYELVSAKDNEDWQIRAVTCELPEIDLGDYKTKIPGEIRAKSIKEAPTREQREQIVVKYLLDNIKFTIPKILIEEEVNSRLSSLLARIEKLGLALESYLASIGKTTESLRTEYEAQAKEAIVMDLILSKIVEDQKVEVPEKEVEEAMKAANAKPESKSVITSVLKKRKALEFLTNLS
jgi:FKBP-type peptidyl-prolyl cis-trans isomerase (trigger factor)